MKRVTLYLSDPQYRRLQDIAARTDRPYSELVRKAIDAYLEQSATAEAASRRAQTRRKT